MTQTTTVSLDQLAAELDVDTDALDAIAADMLGNIDGSYDEKARVFTAEGADMVRASYESHREQGGDSNALDAIADAVTHLDEAERERDAAIRHAFADGINRSDIASAAGLSRARVYQICS